MITLILKKEISKLACTCRRKNEHKHNAYEFLRIANMCIDALKNPYFFARWAEDYVKAANADYELYTGKQLAEIAARTKFNMLHDLEGFHKDILNGIIKI